MPFLALVLWAAALEAERPRRGLPVAVLLALAGLLRPEAWMLAGAYWLWCDRATCGCSRSPPPRRCCGASTDLLVTGDPLFSVHATSALADELGRKRGIEHVPGSFVSFLADTTRAPVSLAGPLGIGLAWWRRDQLRALHVPLALFGAGTLAFAGTGLLGLSILPRYLTVPAIALCLFAGYAVGGFERSARRAALRWTRGALVALVLGLVFVAIRIPSFDKLRNELRFIGTRTPTSSRWSTTPRAPRLRCGPLTLPTYRLVPDLALRARPRPPPPLGACSAQRRHRARARRRETGAPLRPRRRRAARDQRPANGLPAGRAHGMLRAYAAALRERHPVAAAATARAAAARADRVLQTTSRVAQLLRAALVWSHASTVARCSAGRVGGRTCTKRSVSLDPAVRPDVGPGPKVRHVITAVTGIGVWSLFAPVHASGASSAARDRCDVADDRRDRIALVVRRRGRPDASSPGASAGPTAPGAPGRRSPAVIEARAQEPAAGASWPARRRLIYVRAPPLETEIYHDSGPT